MSEVESTEIGRPSPQRWCRAVALHQPTAGVLTVRCVVDAPAADAAELDRAELVFVRGDDADGESEGYRHSLRRIPANGTSAGQAVVFEARIPLLQAQRPVLGPGRWLLRVSLGADDGWLAMRRPSFGRGQWPRITLAAPDGPYRAALVPSKYGLALRVVRRDPHVEIDRVEVDGAALILDGYVVPDAAGGDIAGRLVVRSRHRPEAAVELPVALARGRLHAVVDLDTLPSEEGEFWDLYLRLDGETELRLGSHLDEIGNKRKVFALPAYRVERAGRRLALQPFYTMGNNVSVFARPVEEDTGRDASRAPRPAEGSQHRPRGRVATFVSRGLLATIEAAGRLRRRRAGGQRRKVYFVVHDAFGGGGIARTVLYLAQHLAHDHDVEIITLRRAQRRPAFEIDPRVRLTPLVDEVALSERPGRGIMPWLRRVLEARASWLCDEQDPLYQRQSLWLDLKLLQALRRLQPGVLVTTLPALHVAAARFARPDMTTIGWEHQTFTRRNPLRGRMRAHYPKLDALTVLTPRDAAKYRKLLAGTSSRVVSIPNALAGTPMVRADTNGKLVTAAGRYAPQKGFDLLISAFGKVVDKHPDWQLRIYGKGPLRGRLQRQIQQAGLHHHVLLMDRTDQLADELARSSIFALSSRWEGFGLVIIEAMALGLPVVSFNCPHGPASIISQGVDGTLVPRKDVDALAKAIIDLIESPERRHAQGMAARNTAANYDIDNIGQTWRNLFDELCDPPARP